MSMSLGVSATNQEGRKGRKPGLKEGRKEGRKDKELPLVRLLLRLDQTYSPDHVSKGV